MRSCWPKRKHVFAGEDGGSNWDVLQGKLEQIISFYEPEETPEEEIESAEGEAEEAADEHTNEELANYKKRVENLEKFKKMFFEMESKWEDANKQAEEYHEQLMALGIQLGGGEHFKDLMDAYGNTYKELGEVIIEGGKEAGMKPLEVTPDDSAELANESGAKSESVEVVVEKASVGKTVIQNQEENSALKEYGCRSA